MELFPSGLTPPEYVHPSGLKPLSQPFELKPKLHFLGNDGRVCEIECQGNFAAIAFRKGPLPYKPAQRGNVGGFSLASRLRMIKTVNRLDFSKAGRCTFATATWRDELGCPTPKKITLARSDFQRSVERIAGQKVPGIWRVEWKKRLSGEHKGNYMPHVHSIYFRVPYLNLGDAARSWARAIGYDGRVSFKLEEIKSIRKCLYYVSKYMAKEQHIGNLDNASYLSDHIGGRKWGMHRKNLLPMADQVKIRITPGDIAKRVREVAKKHWQGTPDEEDVGFTVFGEGALEIRKIVDEYTLQHAEFDV